MKTQARSVILAIFLNFSIMQKKSPQLWNFFFHADYDSKDNISFVHLAYLKCCVEAQIYNATNIFTSQ